MKENKMGDHYWDEEKIRVGRSRRTNRITNIQEV